jgi:serine/threonine protein kinase
LQATTQESPLHEIAAMQSVGDHENIISLLQCLQDSNGNLYAVMEFCNEGELYEIAQGGAVDEATAKCYMRQILAGLTHLRDVGICHRDLSLENVLLKDEVCKIIDFGDFIYWHLTHYGLHFLLNVHIL